MPLGAPNYLQSIPLINVAKDANVLNILGEKKHFVSLVSVHYYVLLGYCAAIAIRTRPLRPAGLSVFSLRSRYFESCSSSGPRLLSENTGQRNFPHTQIENPTHEQLKLGSGSTSKDTDPRGGAYLRQTAIQTLLSRVPEGNR